jgi:hypothetical protein
MNNAEYYMVLEVNENKDMILTFDEFRAYLRLRRNTALELLQTGKNKGGKVGR